MTISVSGGAMRGIGQTISRLSAARAFLAGAAILAGTALRPAHAEGSSGQATHADETAMAIPRVQPPGGADGIGLPQPLAPSDAARIRRIFALQKANAIPEAVAETARLADTSLLGHILADRYLAPRARVSSAALSDWLGRYADLPDACAIYALLLKQLPPGGKAPPAPHCPAPESAADPMIAGTVSKPAAAAREFLLRGRPEAAYRLGRAAFSRSNGKDGEAAYVAGLAAWERGESAAAGKLFEAASLAPGAGPGLRSAAAFWAARAQIRLAAGGGEPSRDGKSAGGSPRGKTPAGALPPGVSPLGTPSGSDAPQAGRPPGEDGSWRSWMLRAAESPHTLHGMLARRLLGQQLEASMLHPMLSEADLDAIAATPQGRRAFALLQVQQPARAEAELRLLWASAQTNPPLARALKLTAAAAGLSSLAADIAGTSSSAAETVPVPALHPRGGFHLDPALVYAVAHVESNFDAHSVSGAGANGLMQLMPVAAAVVTKRGAADDFSDLLRDPAQNLRVGQQYLLYLSRDDLAGDNLLHVLASYNSGPGAVQRWAGAADDDPLLFIETIPNEETRRFVQHALVNLWIYAARFHSPSPSLDALARGQWPKFSPEIRILH